MNEKQFKDYVVRSQAAGKVLDMSKGLPAQPGGSQLPPFDARQPPPLPRFQSDYTVEEVKLYADRHSDFFYPFHFEAVAANAQVRDTKRINNDHWFALMSWSMASTGTFSITLVDSSKGIYFSEDPMPSTCIAGTNTDPYYLPNVIMFAPGNMFTVIVLDTSGVENDIDIVFAGRRYRI